MKTILALCCAFILLAIVAENSASPVAQAGTPGTSASKPGSCFRPGSAGRKRRSLELDEDEALGNVANDDFLGHFIQKRQVQGGNGGGNGGNQGGNPWRPPTTTRRPRPQCYNDADCPGNKKCCDGVCHTPSFTG